ncbi:MAG: ATP-binding protein [Nocardiopsaceae bacterium]|nr:ATP-binding protein [Nocardiopsaceae bacterium]
MTGDRGRGRGRPRPPGETASRRGLEQDFDAGSLYALRSAVAAHAAAGGADQDQVYDIVTAAHELAANAVRHGAGHGRLRLWAADQVLTCQVTDPGPAGGAGIPEAGRDRPWTAEHGHGLWVIEQIADRLDIDRGPAGTTVTAVFTLRPPR